MTPGAGVFVKNDFLFSFFRRDTGPDFVLGAFFIAPGIEVRPVLDRNALVFLRDSPLHFPVQLFDQVCMGGHDGLGISVFGLKIFQHLQILHLRIRPVIQPVVRVFQGYAVVSGGFDGHPGGRGFGGFHFSPVSC